jgi:hypothetical protein
MSYGLAGAEQRTGNSSPSSSMATGRLLPRTQSTSDVMLHAGLVCLNGPVGMDLDMQIELFEEALSELDRNSDLINQVLEISTDGEELHILRYNLPS